MNTMAKFFFISLIILLAGQQLCFSQNDTTLRWWNPAEEKFHVVEGRAWHNDLARFYDRLPAKAEKTVRPEVWNLSQNSAGEYIPFTTDASEIVVRYSVAGNRSMNHMPATGVSGVDLYVQDINNNWHWAKGSFTFADTIVYKFSNIVLPVGLKEFRLYLPLYNTVRWMHIGIPARKTFSPLQVSQERPLVLYGTSIMQGACASRPGLAWTNILGRKLNMPIVNLGFSGNGRLEQPLVDLLNETDAKLFVLDCQPNLTDRKVYSEEDIRHRIVNSVKSLQAKHPHTPILLVEHCCGLPSVNIDTSFINRYTWTSKILAGTFADLKKKGVPNIYILTAAGIGFSKESTVDGTHPTDIGMMQYADAYEKIIRKILGLGDKNKQKNKK
jgi:hypothetical protein